MSKIYSPSSNNSATSSETSETQSVDDNSSGNNARAVKNWKRMKDDGDKKRPPWKSVSVSTLPKADKNALLRAKLLDASRRLRLSKLSFAIQVNLPIYKRSRTIGIPIQNDLIPKHDVSILTDGSITLKKEGPGEFILTHSASQMTEAIVGIDTATQTLLPRSTTRFWETYLSTKPYEKDPSFTPSEDNLQRQIREIRKIDEHLCRRSKSYEEMSDDSITSNGDKSALIEHFRNISKSAGSLLKPTLSSWHFEYPVDEEVPWKPYTSKAKTWSSFSNTEIEKRLSNMKLQPIAADKEKTPHQDIQEVAIQRDLFDAVEELVEESNNLLNTFNRLSSTNIRKKLRSATPALKTFDIKFLSDYWVPIVENHKANVQQFTSELRHPEIKTFKPIALEDYSNILHSKSAG